MTNRRKIFLPILIVIVGFMAAVLITRARPSVERQTSEIPAPLVRVIEVETGDLALTVRSQGSVSPRTESVLVAEVAGRIMWVAGNFADGGFFKRGETLLRIDDRDHKLAVAQRDAGVAQATVRLEREQAEAEIARQEWEDIGSGGEPSSLALREPQLAEARANLQAAEAALEQAKLNLSRTRVSGPFAGRIRHKQVDVGQYVGPGTPIATVYSTDSAEIRLPIPKSELAYLDLDLGRDRLDTELPVRLSGVLGRESYEWPAKIVRTGSGFDPKTRMLDLVATIEDPFSLASEETSPLPMGMFVDAEIAGRTAENVALLPRSAVREGDLVLVVDSESRLRFRPVEILRKTPQSVVIEGGIEAGELVCISPLEAVVDGMLVRTVVETDISIGAELPGGAS